MATSARHQATAARSTAATSADHDGVTLDPLAFTIPTSVFTLAGFRKWATSDEFPERLRAAFIEDEVFFDMGNEEVETHVACKTEIVRVLASLVKELKSGKFYADGVLITNRKAVVSNNPDASFVSRDTLLRKRVRLTPRKGVEGQYVEIEGSPDWVLEVVSLSSIAKDNKKLRRAYYRAGIREYWIVDARGADLQFQILQRGKRGYVDAPVQNDWHTSEVFGRQFRLTRVKDDFGLWDYTLESKTA